jgi:hypothetical protein
VHVMQHHHYSPCLVPPLHFEIVVGKEGPHALDCRGVLRLLWLRCQTPQSVLPSLQDVQGIIILVMKVRKLTVKQSILPTYGDSSVSASQGAYVHLC